jgi:hypothetical protein
MSRLTQATKNAKARTRVAARNAKALQGQVEATKLKYAKAYLQRLAKRLPDPKDIDELLGDIRDRWEPPDPKKGGGQAKPAQSQSEQNTRKELLRRAVLVSKSTKQLFEQLVKALKDEEQTTALIRQPVHDVIRAPLPNGRFTADQMDELLVLTSIVISLVERYAKNLKG